MEEKIKIIEPLTDDLEIHDILRGIVRNKEKLWTWQQSSSGQGERRVSYCLLKKVDVIKKFCEITPTKSNPFKFEDKGDIYIFTESRRLACKIKVIEFDPMFIRFVLPVRLNQVSEDFLDKIELVEKENEKENLHKRYTPRKAIKDDKLTGIYKVQDNQEILGFYIIGDVSSGGMSFFVDDPSEFETNQELKIISVGDKEFKKTVMAIVRSVRQVENEHEMKRFKVGVQFLKG